VATVTSLTSARMLAIEASSVVDGDLQADGHLILTKHDGSTIDAGDITIGLAHLRDMLYPVGVIYLSVVATSPATLFGGTWAVWGTGRVPVGIDAADTDFNTVEKTGGEKKHTMLVAEMVSHTHVQTAHTHVQDAHNHTQASHNHGQDWHGHGFVNGARQSFGMYYGALTGGGVTFSLSVAAVNTGSYQGSYVVDNGIGTNIATTGTNVAATATNQTTAAVNQTTGSTTPFNVQQKFITCYMWKRTA